MSNLVFTLYLMDSLNICHTLREEYDEYGTWWVIETEKKDFWFRANGNYYGTITKIPELEQRESAIFMLIRVDVQSILRTFNLTSTLFHRIIYTLKGAIV